MTYKQLSGNYVYNNSIELRFTENPNRFEYYTRGEMGLLQYSTGEWKRNKNKVYLTGFTDKDVNMLNVESAVAKSINSNDTQVQIFYSRDKAAPYIKSVVIINDNAIYKIAKDTILAPEYKVETIQAKSYLSYEGLLSSPPKVDTLYSRKIRIDDAQGKTIMLKFSVNSKDFVRTTLADTIEVKNNRTLLYNKIKLKKIAMVQEAAK
ncbi:MAG TPA: hypothetical protein VHE34_17245 [Puia sp.]|uniref:hypothetical protein n=1 Tax=Puia sp. TaxID=2045100 RepID=UPI002C7299F4|nr:hypothetical protein [Puia sp.]HVU96981.1 hypothetical protein [Puia sp.]